MLLKSTPSYTDPTFGFTFQDDDILKGAFVQTIQPQYQYSNIFYNPRSTNKKLRGTFVNSIHGTCDLTSYDTLKQICLLHKQWVLEFALTFALENELLFKKGWERNQ